MVLFIIIVVAIILVMLFGWFLGFKVPRTILRPGRPPIEFDVEARFPTAEQFTLTGADDTFLDALYLPCPTEARANLIVLHGIGGCKEPYLEVLSEARDIGYNLLLWDQRAHGRSGGAYTTYGANEELDVAAGFEWLNARTNKLPTGLYGNSMGGAVALQALAGDKRLRFGLIESTFTDLATITNAYAHRLSGLPLPRWITDMVLIRAGRIAGFRPMEINPLRAALKVTQPVQLIHGDEDENIDVAHVHGLYNALGSEDKRLYIVPGGGHANHWTVGGPEYWRTFNGFLREMAERFGDHHRP